MKDLGSSGGTRTGAIIALIAVGVVVAILAVLAYARAQGSGASDPPAPIGTPSVSASPSVSPSVAQTPSVAPSAAPGPAAVRPAATERFLTVGGNALWRATAGACGGPEPRVERSADSGRTWADVTPRDVAQVASVDPLGSDGAQLVAAVGSGCGVEGLRTSTAGQSWEQNADSLRPYLNVANAAQVVAPGGPIAAPCPAAHGVRATGDVLALVCDQFAYVRTGAGWTKLSSLEVLAVAVSAKGEIIVAHTGVPGCTGLALARFANAGVTTPAGAGCAQVPTAGPMAIAAGADGTYVWAGDAVTLVR